MTKKVGNISRREYTVFDTINNISDNGKLFNIIEDLNDKGFMFKYNGEWITKDDCKHFLSDDTNSISIDLYHDVQGNSDKQSPKISKPVRKYPEQGEFVFDSRRIKSSKPQFDSHMNKNDVYDFIRRWNYVVGEEKLNEIASVEYDPNSYETVDGAYVITYKDGSIETAGWADDIRGFRWLNTKHNHGPIQSSRRIQSMVTPKNVYLNEDTQKLIQRLEKRVGHELELKFEEDTPYVEIEKLPKGGYSFITEKYFDKLAENYLFDGYKEKQDSFIVYLDPAIMYTKPEEIKSSLSDILQDKEALPYFTVEELQRMNYNEWLLKKITADEHTENDNLITKLYKEHIIKSSRQITSAKSEEEFEDIIIQIEDILGVNVEHSNIFNLPVELSFEDECYIDDICREQNCKFVPVNGSRRRYRLIQSSRRNNMIKSTFEQADSSEYNPDCARGRPGMIYYAGWYIDQDTPWIVEKDTVSGVTVLAAFATQEEANDYYNTLHEPDLEPEQLLPDYSYSIVNVLDVDNFDDLYAESLVSSVRRNNMIKSSMGEMQEWNTLSDDEKKQRDEPYNKAADEWIAKQNQLERERKRKSNEVLDYWRKQGLTSSQIQSKLDTVKVTFDNGDTIVTDYNADVGREEIAKYYMHNYFNVGGEDEMHQVVKVEFPGNINSARTPEVADMQDAEDLALFAENDHELYDMVIKPTFDSLQRKLKRGIYDKDKALIAWEHVIDEAAKAYDRQLGSKRGTMTMFNKATRKEAAKILMDSIWDEDEWQV